MTLLDFPPGDNATDTLIGGVHFNLTTLRTWQYELYSNRTLSNGSWCMLVWEPFTPRTVLENGTFPNSTWCYAALNPVGVRGGVGIGFAALFGIAIVLTLACLRRHGSLHLPVTKRFYPIGRRWQWYWALVCCGCALVSLIANIDVDRFYLPELPVILTAMFWYLLQMCTMALVWEAVRHWGSWMERQFVDPDPFVLSDDDARFRFEFFIPLVFYLFLWLNFFLVVPRNWGPLQNQRSAEQTVRDAIPAATDARIKAAAFSLFISWVVCVVSLRHSIKHYQPRNRGLLNRAVGLFKFAPLRLQLLLVLSLAMVAYQTLVSFEWEYSPINLKGNIAAMYAGGFAPAVLIVYIQIIAGFMRPNEDLELIRQRRIRGVEEDAQLGLTRKPAWWRRARGQKSMRDIVARNVREIRGGRPSAAEVERVAEMRAAGATEAEVDAARGIVEMRAMPRSTTAGGVTTGGLPSVPSATPARPVVEMYDGRSERRRTERTRQAVAELLFPAGASGPTPAERRADLMQDGPPPPYRPPGQTGQSEQPGQQTRPRSSAERSNSSASITQPPQQVRSMLDV